MGVFIPKIRFLVMSDIHVKSEKDCKELARLKTGLRNAYAYAEECDYNKIDAFFAVGDFANSGAEEEMQNFKEVLDEYLKPETDVTIALASHEYGRPGEDVAKERFSRIFGMHYDAHKIINGFHFISLSTTNGCDFREPQKEFAAKELKIAAADSMEKPIFFFQHPHINGTVYGSIIWGDCELYPILMNYPQVIDFSGHSHAPINDPRSIHQEHFTSLGTGSLSYFELDEFDKVYGTIPPDKEQCAQFLIVEADENNRVRIMPYDILTEQFFPYTWKIDTPSEPSTFLYTDKRYETKIRPHFTVDTPIETEVNNGEVTITFGQADIEEDRVNDYKIVIRNSDKKIVKQIAIWSGYYLYDMPETLSVTVNDLPTGKYSVRITARGFWKNVSDNSLRATFCIH